MSNHFEIRATIKERPILVIGFDEQLSEEEVDELLKSIRQLRGVIDAERFISNRSIGDYHAENIVKFKIQEALYEFIERRLIKGETREALEEFIREHLRITES